MAEYQDASKGVTDFSANATSLSAPQGAGSTPISPVTPAQEVSVISGSILSTVGDLLTNGIAQNRKLELMAKQKAVVDSYIDSENSISDALQQGTISASEAAVRSRSNFRKHAAGHSEYMDELSKAANGLKGNTEIGTAFDEVKAEKDRTAAGESLAQTRGYIFLPGMTKEQRQSQVSASQAGITAERNMSQFYAKQSEARAQGTYDQGIADRELKKLSFDTVNMVAGENLAAFQSFGKATAESVRKGTMTKEDGEALLSERYSNIAAALQASARTNPELAAPYKAIFDSVFQIHQKMLDPKNVSDDLENQLKIRTTQLKLVAMGDPKIAAAVVANQLLPNNASLALSSAPEGVRTIALLSSQPVNTKEYTPNVVGNPEVESDALKLLKGGLTSLAQGKVSDKELAIIQASNSINHVLKQTGEMLDKGASPQQLKGVAEFFASPEYAKFVTSNQIDSQSAGAAKKAFQLIYEPTIIKGVQEKLNQNLDLGHSYDPTALRGAHAPNAKKPISVSDSVDIKFTGSGIVFDVPADAASGAAGISQRSIVESLKTSQLAINQLIHIGAHMEGSTDYNKYWEENKHIWLPSIYPDPVQLKPGAVVDGFKYIGGSYRDRKNWQPVK